MAEAGKGACAEYVVVAADQAVRMPPELGFAEAAATPMAAGTAVQGVREEGRVTSGDRFLAAGGVYGATGGGDGRWLGPLMP